MGNELQERLGKAKTANQWYGWNPDRPDFRDHKFTAMAKGRAPSAIDWRAKFPSPPFDQGQLGSCTANAVVGAIMYDRHRQSKDAPIYSRLFEYYNSRLIEGTTDEDSGATIRDAVKAFAKFGALPEERWPYDIANFTARPVQADYDAAFDEKPVSYARLTPSLSALKATLAAGYVVTFGFSVYDSFESQQVAETGVVPMPATDEQLLGGHAVLLCGYSDKDKRWIVRNSWGTDWGQAGYFTMPYEYLTNSDLADDFWVIRSVK